MKFNLNHWGWLWLALTILMFAIGSEKIVVCTFLVITAVFGCAALLAEEITKKLGRKQ